MTPDKPGWWWLDGHPVEIGEIDGGLACWRHGTWVPVSVSRGEWGGPCLHARLHAPAAPLRPIPDGVTVERPAVVAWSQTLDDVSVTIRDGRVRLLIDGSPMWCGSPADARKIAAALLYIADELAP